MQGSEERHGRDRSTVKHISRNSLKLVIISNLDTSYLFTPALSANSCIFKVKCKCSSTNYTTIYFLLSHPSSCKNMYSLKCTIDDTSFEQYSPNGM